jgi:hypothetical protein
VSGWGAGYPGVPSDVAQKAKAEAEAKAKAAEPQGEDSGAETSEDQGA